MATDITPALPRSAFRGLINQFGADPVECHVLEDGRDLITATGILIAFVGHKTGNLEQFLSRIPGGSALFSSYTAIRFRLPDNNGIARGYPADFLIDLCTLSVSALARGELHPKQIPAAIRASIVLTACAKVGITSIVHEATGYQEHRAKNALQDKLAVVLMREAGRWKQLFTLEFFREMGKLYRLQLIDNVRRPWCFAALIREFFYEWFDEDVYAELRKRNPKPSGGTKHHQFLTPFARERFERHQRDVLILMRASSDIEDFRMRFGAAFRGQGLQLSFGGR
jgi:hypothetical protein